MLTDPPIAEPLEKQRLADPPGCQCANVECRTGGPKGTARWQKPELTGSYWFMTAFSGFGGKALSVLVPRRSSSAYFNCTSSFGSGGT